MSSFVCLALRELSVLSSAPRMVPCSSSPQISMGTCVCIPSGSPSCRTRTTWPPKRAPRLGQHIDYAPDRVERRDGSRSRTLSRRAIIRLGLARFHEECAALVQPYMIICDKCMYIYIYKCVMAPLLESGMLEESNSLCHVFVMFCPSCMCRPTCRDMKSS